MSSTTTRQRPIDSGFGPHSTTSDVVAGDTWLAYGQSKTANVLFVRHLNAHGVQAFAVHPGEIAPSGVRAYAVDPDAAARLWAVSARLTGVDALA